MICNKTYLPLNWVFLSDLGLKYQRTEGYACMEYPFLKKLILSKLSSHKILLWLVFTRSGANDQ